MIQKLSTGIPYLAGLTKVVRATTNDAYHTARTVNPSLVFLFFGFVQLWAMGRLLDVIIVIIKAIAKKYKKVI